MDGFKLFKCSARAKVLSLPVAFALVVLSGTAGAVVVDTALWSTEVSPSYGAGPTGLTSAGGNQAEQQQNSYGTIVSNFSFIGDFNFQGTLTPTTTQFDDNDILGLVFGWQDASNHYRLGWEQGGLDDSGSGASGLFLVREQAGTPSILFQQELFWSDNTGYNFSVGRAGDDISFSLGGVSQLFTDTVFLSGKVGFYTESQTARFSGLSSAPQPPATVPEPGTMGLLGLSLLGLTIARRKTRPD